MASDRLAPGAGAMKVVAMMTAYNEQACIGPLVRGIVTQGVDCIVVDDGSRDRTGEIARAAGARVLRHSINLGQGHALLTGFKAALLGNADVIIELDADGQHDPALIATFVEALVRCGTDIVVGSRVLGSNHGDAPWLRRRFLRPYTALVNFVTGYRMTDAMCGYRAFRAEPLRRHARVLDEMLEPQYIAAEMFIRFARAGMTVAEIPIALQNRQHGRSRKGALRYGYGVLKAIARSHRS